MRLKDIKHQKYKISDELSYNELNLFDLEGDRQQGQDKRQE